MLAAGFLLSWLRALHCPLLMGDAQNVGFGVAGLLPWFKEGPNLADNGLSLNPTG
jgi:hypothetical protein